MIDRLIAEASEFYGLGGGAFFSPQRGYATRAREAVAHVAQERMGWSVQRLAQHFGKDRHAIYDGALRTRDRLKTDPIFYELVTRLEQIVTPFDDPGL